jgi:hypothetical protein
MCEAALNARVMKALKFLHPVRVENSACPGTPDINYLHGWIEDKWIPTWPHRETIVRCDHFTAQQRVWHTLRSLAGGRTYVMLQVERDYLLFEGKVAAEVLGKSTQARLVANALGVWRYRLNDEEFIKIVTE